jgi:hypothetical protein
VGRLKGNMPSFMGIVERSKSEEWLVVSKVYNDESLTIALSSFAFWLILSRKIKETWRKMRIVAVGDGYIESHVSNAWCRHHCVVLVRILDDFVP